MRTGGYRLFFITKRSGVTKQSLPQPLGTRRYATLMRADGYRLFFITKRSGVTKQSPPQTLGTRKIRNAYESGRLPAICYYGVEANYVRLELCSPVGPGNSLVNPHVFITRGKYGGFRINRGLVFGKARHDRKNQRDRHCLRKQTIGTRYFQKPVGPLFA